MPRLVSIAMGPTHHLCGLDEEGRLWRAVCQFKSERDENGHWRVEGAGSYRWELWPLEFVEEPAAELR